MDLVKRRELHEQIFGSFRFEPVRFVTGFLGAKPDPWQSDVLTTLADPAVFNVALRSCHGTGKTATLSWAIIWFLLTRWESEVVSTSTTFNKQVKDVLWGQGVHFWWNRAVANAPFLRDWFACLTTSMHAVGEQKESWFAVGVASKEAINLEGYHASSILLVFDEAKGIPKSTWEAIHGMRTTREPKFIAASTPGGINTEFHRIWDRPEYRSTWKHTFQVHPRCLRDELVRQDPAKRREAEGVGPDGRRWRGRYARGGTYYSSRFPRKLQEERAAEWGVDNPAYITRVIGDFPTLESNRLIRYDLIVEAEHREVGAEGATVVGCDVARSGVDRTIAFVARGGTVIDGASVARAAAETTAKELFVEEGVVDPKRPYYRDEAATADLCIRLALKHGATVIGVDDTGLGGGVTTIVRRKGWTVVPIVFGASPTDKPKDKETRDWKVRREGSETKFLNLKAQMAWAMRGAFEDGAVSLMALNDEGGPLWLALGKPLVGQLAAVRQDMTDKGLIKVVDPDMVTEVDAYFDDAEEVKRSPDHMHALMIALWLSLGHHRPVRPQLGAARHQGHQGQRLGRPRGGAAWGQDARATEGAGAPVQPVSSSGVGGQALHLNKLL